MHMNVLLKYEKVLICDPLINTRNRVCHRASFLIVPYVCVMEKSCVTHYSLVPRFSRNVFYCQVTVAPRNVFPQAAFVQALE